MPSNAGHFARSVLSTYEARRDPLTVFASKSAGWSTRRAPITWGRSGRARWDTRRSLTVSSTCRWVGVRFALSEHVFGSINGAVPYRRAERG